MYRCFPLASLLLIALFFVPCVQAGPAETIAPLIGEETVAVIRVDLQKIDLQNIAKTLTSTVQDTVKALELPEEQSQQINGALQFGLMFGLPMVQGVLDKLIVEGKADEAFILLELDPENDAATPICLVAIPVGDKGKEETNAIRVALKESLQMQVNFVRHGFVLGMYVASDEEKDAAMEFAKERFKKLDPMERPFLPDAFDRFADYSVQAVVIPTETFKSQAKAGFAAVGTIDDDQPNAEQVKEIQAKLEEMFPDKLAWYGFAVDFNRLAIHSTLTMEDAATGKELDDLIKEFKVVMFDAMEQSEDMMSEDFNADMVKKAIDLFTPKHDGATLSLTIDRKLFTDNSELFTKIGKAMMAAVAVAQRHGGLPGMIPLAP